MLPWDLRALLPHREPMLLLDRVLGLEDDDFVAEVCITPDSPFFANGGVPAYVGIEYMAQTVAAFNGMESRQRGSEPKAGFLLGTREYRCTLSTFADGSVLRVRVRKDIHESGGVSSLACLIVDAEGNELASAQLTVYEVNDLKAALRGDA